MHKIRQSGGFLGRLLGPLLKSGLPLIGNVLKPLTTSILIPPELTAVSSTTDAVIHRKMFASGLRPRRLAPRFSDLAKQSTLIISNEEMNDIMKIVTSLEGSGLVLMKQLKIKQKNKKEDLLEWF